MEEGLDHVDGQPSLCYWSFFNVTVKTLCDDVKKARQQQKFQIEIPTDLGDTMRRAMVKFKSMNKCAGNVDALSSVIFDLRSAQQVDDEKHKNQTATLNR